MSELHYRTSEHLFFRYEPNYRGGKTLAFNYRNEAAFVLPAVAQVILDFLRTGRSERELIDMLTRYADDHQYASSYVAELLEFVDHLTERAIVLQEER